MRTLSMVIIVGPLLKHNLLGFLQKHTFQDCWIKTFTGRVDMREGGIGHVLPVFQTMHQSTEG